MRQTSGELKALETKLQGKRELRQQVLAYARPSHPRGAESAESEKSPRRIPPGKRERFYHSRSRRPVFQGTGGLPKLPGRKALQARDRAAYLEKDGLYNTYHEQKQRFRELQTVKRNIDQILRRGRAAPQKGAEP